MKSYSSKGVCVCVCVGACVSVCVHAWAGGDQLHRLPHHILSKE